MQRCDFSEQFSYTKETFGRQLSPLAESSLLGEWRRAALEDALSTQAKRKLLLGQLRNTSAMATECDTGCGECSGEYKRRGMDLRQNALPRVLP